VPTPSSLFETDRLTVRAWTHDDADALYDLYSRWDVARWLGAAPRALTSVEETAGLVDRWSARSVPDPTYGVWCVSLRATGTPVGTVLLVPLGDATAGEVEVGWHLHPDHWGRGYATEAARGALERGFGAGLTDVLAVVNPDNERSQAVCRRLGMEHLGRSERYYGMPLEVFRAGRPAVVTPIADQ
jgi:RimJ/RimL family protein N-acetyltransferase